MASLPGKVANRLIAGIKKYQPILTDQKNGDAGEADTSHTVRCMLSEVFGYDDLSEITAELPVKSTRCDLAIKIKGKISTVIEVKAIGTALNPHHTEQVVEYAIKLPVNWAILTNGITWRVYYVTFTKPIEEELVVEIDFLKPDLKSDIEKLYLWTKEGWVQTALEEYAAQKQALSKFLIAAAILSDPVLQVIRKQLKKVAKLSRESTDVKIDISQIEEVLKGEVIVRAALEDPKAKEAAKKVEKAANVSLHDIGDKDEQEKSSVVVPTSEKAATAIAPDV